MSETTQRGTCQKMTGGAP